MNLRYAIADWISGGELTRLDEDDVEFLKTSAAYLFALRDIAALETPNASHTVKKAARIAREALGDD